MDKKNTLCFTNRKEWCKWLEENHSTQKEIWLIYFKKHTGKPTLIYEESVQEALCWGWIDSIIKRIDDEKYARKFTPRTNYENWSNSNIERMRKLAVEKKVTEAGLKKFPKELFSKKLDSKPKKLIIPDYIQTEIDKHPKAKSNFEKLTPSHKRNYVGWIDSSKKKKLKCVG